MFQELFPLLANGRVLMLTLTQPDPQRVTVVVQPMSLSGTENAGLSVPLKVTATPEQLDAEFPAALSGFATQHRSITAALADTTRRMQEATAPAGGGKGAAAPADGGKSGAAPARQATPARAAAAAPTPPAVPTLWDDALPPPPAEPVTVAEEPDAAAEEVDADLDEAAQQEDADDALREVA